MNRPTNLLLVVVGDVIELILVLGDHFFQLVHLNISWINILLQKASYIYEFHATLNIFSAPPGPCLEVTLRTACSTVEDEAPETFLIESYWFLLPQDSNRHLCIVIVDLKKSEILPH